MKTKLFTFFLSILIGLSAFSQGYKVNMDLVHIKKDRVKVTMVPPEVKQDSILFIMPLVVPGTYSKYDFGRFITGFKAFDKNKRPLKVRKTPEYFYSIPAGSGISRIEYFVDDTWDTPDTAAFVFQPGGSNIEKGKNIVINNHAFFGYLDGFKMLPYEINVTKPAIFYGSTSMQKKSIDKTHDVFYSENYVKLVDHPILYCKPDTTSFISGGARIAVSVYSPRGLIKSDSIADMIKPLSLALEHFFTKLPVDHYSFLVYFKDLKEIDQSHKGGFGALEHSYSSLYYLPEMGGTMDLKSMLLGVMSHEFLHILTPLNIHSEEIEHFDFKDPKMSRHLWLYEGVTEYFANLVQVRDSLISYSEFMNAMNEKIRTASQFPDVSFTEMSRKILTNEFKSMYQNVYEKGALIGFLLDIRLHELSNGQMGLREVMMKLKDKYGPSRPFEDEDLLAEIVALSHPDIKGFFDSCVIGAQTLPYESYFKKIGWRYAPSKPDVINSFGQVGFMYDENKKVFKVTETDSEMNAFGLSNEDILTAVNGQELSVDNYTQLLLPLVDVKTTESITVEFKRGGKTIKRTASPRMIEVSMNHVLEEDESASETAKTLRKKMLNH